MLKFLNTKSLDKAVESAVKETVAKMFDGLSEALKRELDRAALELVDHMWNCPEDEYQKAMAELEKESEMDPSVTALINFIKAGRK